MKIVSVEVMPTMARNLGETLKVPKTVQLPRVPVATPNIFGSHHKNKKNGRLKYISNTLNLFHLFQNIKLVHITLS